MPARIQLSRKKGWRMPPGATKVDRSTMWGNPFRVGDDGITTVEQCVRLFGKLLERPDAELDKHFFMFRRVHIQSVLRDRDLACWCRPGSPCHAELLLEIANGPLCKELQPSEHTEEKVHVDSK